MPSYYVAKKNRCNGYDCGVSSVGSVQKIVGSEASTYTQISGTNNVNAFYNSLSVEAIEQKGQGNIMKKGSGGNSYADYMARKKCGLQQYCGN